MEAKVHVDEEPVLVNQFLTTGNHPVTASLFSRSLLVQWDENPLKAKRVSFEDAVGVEQKPDNIIIVHYYVPQTECCEVQRTHLEVALHHVDPAVLNLWRLRFTQLLWNAPLDDTMPTRSMLILVNPASGSGRAQATLDQVLPIFEQSNIRTTVISTTHARHAFELAQQMDFSKVDYEAIVTVSGDGLVAEVFNGLMNRPDWQEATQRVKLGTIGGGSGNGLAKSILSSSQEAYAPLNSAFLISKGYSRKMDVFTVTQKGQDPVFGFLSLGWALISDIDFESERYRWCGGFRFTWTALERLCCLRSYNANLSYLVAPSSYTHPSSSADVPAADNRELRSSPSSSLSDSGANLQRPLHRSAASSQYTPCSSAETCLVCRPVQHDPALSEKEQLASYLARMSDKEEKKVPSAEERKDHKQDEDESVDMENWVTVEEDLTLLWAMNLSHAATDMHVAPYAHWSDGCFDLEFVTRQEGGGCCSMLSTLLSIEDGTHIQKPSVQYVKVRALRLTPQSTRQSQMSIDGERIPYAPIEIRMFRGVINIMSR